MTGTNACEVEINDNSQIPIEVFNTLFTKVFSVPGADIKPMLAELIQQRCISVTFDSYDEADVIRKQALLYINRLGLSIEITLAGDQDEQRQEYPDLEASDVQAIDWKNFGKKNVAVYDETDVVIRFLEAA
jgi:hypothetical protein